MTYCFEHKIYLLRLPAHTSHITQPLDVGCFAPLKTYYRDGAEKLCRGGSLGVTKAAFIDLYYNARVKAMTKANMVSYRSSSLQQRQNTFPILSSTLYPITFCISNKPYYNLFNPYNISINDASLISLQQNS